MQTKTVGVLGCGTMGAGISEVSARAGHEVIFVELDDLRVKTGLDRIDHSLARAEVSGKITAEERRQTFGRISGATDLGALSAADIVIEAIPENLDIKKQAFAELDSILGPDAILATNTSSLPVIELGVATKRPERVLGIHFFNPAPVMELVELVSTVTSSPEVVLAATEFVEELGKTPVRCRDRAGFIANLLLFPYLNEAVKLLEAGFASREDIDTAMRMGAGHPMGPLSLLDLVGLDSCAEILESLYKQFADRRYAPSPVFRHLVTARYLGRKAAKGFYTYDEPDSPRVVEDDRSGRIVPLPEPGRPLSKVGIAGTGTMGSGLAEVAARAGFEVVCLGRTQDSLDRARTSVEKSLGRALEKGKITESERDQTYERLDWSTNVESLADCHLVIEAVAEDLEVKRELFARLDAAVNQESILGTCTSSLPVMEIAAATSRPDRVLGVHFFNPPAIMRLVELVRTVATSAQVVADVRAAVERMGKQTVLCEDRAGFIVNRLLFPFLNDAIRMLENGYASAEDIDTAMKLGCRHPMGPLALIDLVGLDVTHEILASLHAEFREQPYAPAPLLEHMVKAGYLGRKSGRGFYTY